MEDMNLLLIEAKRLYPIGTTVTSLGGNNNCLIVNSEFYIDGNNIKIMVPPLRDFMKKNRSCTITHTIKDSRKWANIIKQGNSIITNYSIF